MKRCFAGVVALFVSAGIVDAQHFQVEPPAGTCPDYAEPVLTCLPDCPCTVRFWASADYLYWWEKNGPLPVPLVTANNDPGAIGALNEPGTRVIFGGSAGDLNFSQLSGIRATAGLWFNCDATIGAEFSGFIFQNQNEGFSASSAGGTAPIVSIPFNATQPFLFNPAGETSLNAGNTPNTVTVGASSRLWGFEANNLFRVCGNPNGRITLLGGFRYLQLEESLGLNDTFFDSATAGIISVTDSFQTRNQIFAGQLGVRGEWNWGKFNVAGTIKCALGVDVETSTIGGNSVVTNGAFGFPTGTVAGGVFTNSSNIGTHSSNAFAVAPEAQVQVGYDIGRHIRAEVGYNFLYINDVLRPGQQIDRNINPTQNVLFGGTGGVPSGPLSPLGTTHSSDFWAHGLNFGVRVRF